MMKVLSIFIDESGDFGIAEELPAYYLVTFVLHDQRIDISEQISKLNSSISIAGYSLDYIHTGPIIRGEDFFRSYSLDDRRKLLYKMLNFITATPITTFTIAIERTEKDDKVALSGKLAKAIKEYVSIHHKYFYDYQRIIVYYDNGQSELSSVLNAVFTMQFSDVEFRKASPQEYKLLQAADFFCSMELLRLKREEDRLSNTEKKFFYKSKELQKTFLKSVEKKKQV